MKHTVTELHDPSEPVLFSDCIMGNYMYELGFGNLKLKIMPFLKINSNLKLEM